VPQPTAAEDHMKVVSEFDWCQNSISVFVASTNSQSAMAGGRHRSRTAWKAGSLKRVLMIGKNYNAESANFNKHQSRLL
jgi:hypothetical protein